MLTRSASKRPRERVAYRRTYGVHPSGCGQTRSADNRRYCTTCSRMSARRKLSSSGKEKPGQSCQPWNFSSYEGDSLYTKRARLANKIINFRRLSPSYVDIMRPLATSGVKLVCNTSNLVFHYPANDALRVRGLRHASRTRLREHVATLTNNLLVKTYN